MKDPRTKKYVLSFQVDEPRMTRLQGILEREGTSMSLVLREFVDWAMDEYDRMDEEDDEGGEDTVASKREEAEPPTVSTPLKLSARANPIPERVVEYTCPGCGAENYFPSVEGKCSYCPPDPLQQSYRRPLTRGRLSRTV